MNVCSLEFLVGLAVLAALFFFISPGRPRQVVLALCNVAFLALQVPNIASAVALAIFVLSGYIIGQWVRSTSDAKARARTVGVYIALLVAAFIILKEYQFLDRLIPPGSISRWVSIVGLSYMLFRQIHYVVDMSQDQIERPSLWTYLNYQLNLFALLAGPIQRYHDFSERWDSPRPLLLEQHDMLKAWARVLAGVIKVAFLGGLFLDLANRSTAKQLHVSHPRDLVKFAVLFYGYPAYIYFNFSGYCDIVVAGAALVGIRLPENFDRPYLARNPIDFWARWHMSLTNWIRDYLFNPLYKAGVERWPARALGWSYACYFIALFLAGVWHGSTWNFMVFGLLHGAGVSAAKMWEARVIRRWGRPGLREYLKSDRIRYMARVATFHFVCFTFLFFSPNLRERVHFLRYFLWDRPAGHVVV